MDRDKSKPLDSVRAAALKAAIDARQGAANAVVLATAQAFEHYLRTGKEPRAAEPGGKRGNASAANEET